MVELYRPINHETPEVSQQQRDDEELLFDMGNYRHYESMDEMKERRAYEDEKERWELEEDY